MIEHDILPGGLTGPKSFYVRSRDGIIELEKHEEIAYKRLGGGMPATPSVSINLAGATELQFTSADEVQQVQGYFTRNGLVQHTRAR